MLIKFIAFLLYCQLSFALLIPHVLKPRIFSLRSTKQRLQTTINPLVPTRKFQKDFSIHSVGNENGEGSHYTNKSRSGLVNENFVIIPKELINPTMFSTLGLNKLFNLGDHEVHSHKWMNFSIHDQIYIPQEFKTYFIFNTSSIKHGMGLDLIHNMQQSQPKQDDQPQDQHYSSHTLNKFLLHLVPFDIPELVELVDYYMVVPNLPNLQNLTSSIYHEGLLSYPMLQLPVFRSQLSGNKPLIVFMFNETDESIGSNDIASSSSLLQPKTDPHSKTITQIMSIKNYLKSPTTFSTFFDKFARDWIDQVDYDSLVHSVFCNVNSHDEDHSFCLKLRQQVVDIVPAFKKFVARTDPNVGGAANAMSSLLKLNKVSSWKNGNDDDAQVQIQAVRQVHDKLQAKKHALTMVGTTGVNLIRNPKDALYKLDDFIDDKLDDQLSKLDDKKDSLWSSLDDKKDSMLGSIEDKKVSVVGSVKESLGNKKSALLDEFDASVDGGGIITSIDDKRLQFTDLIQRRKDDLQTWKFKPQLFEKPMQKKQKQKLEKGGIVDKLKMKLIRGDDAENDDYDSDGNRDSDYDHPALHSDYSDDAEQYGRHKRSIRKRNTAVADAEHVLQKRYLDDASVQPGVGEYIEQGGFSLPLSLLNYHEPQPPSAAGNINEEENEEFGDDLAQQLPPRKTTYSQVMNMDTLSPTLHHKRSSSNDGSDKEPCQPITWYNIFHHSVFGEPNLCNED